MILFLFIRLTQLSSCPCISPDDGRCRLSVDRKKKMLSLIQSGFDLGIFDREGVILIEGFKFVTRREGFLCLELFKKLIRIVQRVALLPMFYKLAVRLIRLKSTKHRSQCNHQGFAHDVACRGSNEKQTCSCNVVIRRYDTSVTWGRHAFA